MDIQKHLEALPLESFQNLRFGIREKITLLVVLVAVVVAFGTSYFLQRISASMVERHELVDLADEANLRAWEIVDGVSQLEKDLRVIAEDEEIQFSVYSDLLEGSDRGLTPAALEALNQRFQFHTGSDKWKDYLRIDIMEANAGKRIPVRQQIRDLEGQKGLAEIRAELIERAECLPSAGTILLLSTIHRLEVEVAVPPQDPEGWMRKWVPVVMACAPVKPSETFEEAATRYLVFTMQIRPPASPRHLFFLVDASAAENRQSFLMHPNMATQKGFEDEDMFAESIAGLLREPREELAAKSERGRLERLGLIRDVPLAQESYFYFREGLPTRTVQQRLDDLMEADPERHDKFLNNIVGTEESSDRHIGGMTDVVPEVRLLAKTEDDVLLRKRSQPNFIGLVERDIRYYTELPESTKLVDWGQVLTCKSCHIASLDFYLDSVEGRRNYLLMYAAFHEEFVGAINQEISSALIWWVMAFGSGALVLASGLAIVFVQPMHRLTETAQEVASDEGHLHEKLADLSATLPVDRADEVGDIARAAQKLFSEILSSHDLLERRVEERTRELKVAYEQLEGLAKQKDAFLANVSHELRTPLTAVSGYLQLLKRRKLEERNLKYVHKALKGASHLEALIDDILDFQKIIMGGITLEGEEFEVCTLLSELTDGLQFNAGKNGNQLQCTCDDDLTTIHTDRQRLRQVLTNLVSNACKFTNQGVIKIEAAIMPEDGYGENWVR